jgi:hypothetical protein
VLSEELRLSALSQLLILKQNKMDRTTKLKMKILERVDILRYFEREITPFPLQAYKILCDELKRWRIELAELEHELAVHNYKLIKSN